VGWPVSPFHKPRRIRNPGEQGGELPVVADRLSPSTVLFPVPGTVPLPGSVTQRERYASEGANRPTVPPSVSEGVRGMARSEGLSARASRRCVGVTASVPGVGKGWVVCRGRLHVGPFSVLHAPTSVIPSLRGSVAISVSAQPTTHPGNPSPFTPLFSLLLPRSSFLSPGAHSSPPCVHLGRRHRLPPGLPPVSCGKPHHTRRKSRSNTSPSFRANLHVLHF
jgi:hypothetical protein